MANEMKFFAFEDDTTRITFEIVDPVARGALDKLPIKLIESPDAKNPVALRTLDSGTYILYGKFIAYPGTTSILSFSSALMVNIIRSSSISSVQVFYPVNNCVQFLEITDSTFTRKNLYLNTMSDNIGTLTALETVDKSSLVAAINEVLGTITKPRIFTIPLPASGWVGAGDLYSQSVTVDGVTATSKIDLQPSPEQLAELLDANISLVAANDEGSVTVFAIGDVPTSDYEMQIIVTEVSG